MIKDFHDPANNVKFFPLRWMQQQDEPAVKTRSQQGWARTQQLWNAASDDKVVQMQNPKWSPRHVNAAILGWQGSADDQSDKQRGIFKSARTQQLFGIENVAAEKETEAADAAKLVAKAAAANSAADFEKTAEAENGEGKWRCAAIFVYTTSASKAFCSLASTAHIILHVRCLMLCHKNMHISAVVV